jgi:hypothetical protein
MSVLVLVLANEHVSHESSGLLIRAYPDLLGTV